MRQILLAAACFVASSPTWAQPAPATSDAAKPDQAAAPAEKVDKPAEKKEVAEKSDADKPAAVAEKPAALDAGLRTFAGACIIDPVGKEQQALPLLAGAVAGFLPQIASAAIDALTTALDKAGQDQVTSITAVLPLENRPRCIQIARGATVPSSLVMTDGPEGGKLLQRALRDAPFLVEFLIRISRDGSAISISPTVMRYGETLDGKHMSSGARDMYATITFSNVGSSETSQVSVPLGSYPPRMKEKPHYFDPVSEPKNAASSYPTGAAASPWIKSPYVVARSSSSGSGSDARPQARASSSGGDGSGGSSTDSATAGSGTAATPQAPAPQNEPFGATTPPAPVGTPPTPALAAPPGSAAPAPSAIRVGDEIKPITIAVTLRETRPGSAFARTVSSILKGNKQKLVDAADPAKEREARAAALTGWKTNQTAYATALGDYYKKKAAYCTGATVSQDLVGHESEGADLLSAEVTLIAAARTSEIVDLPFTNMVNPSKPDFTMACGS